MKKVLVFLVAIGFILSAGAGAYVSASAEDYKGIPDVTMPVPR